MTMNSSGQISLGGGNAGSSINLENKQPANQAVSLNDANVRKLAKIPSGQIQMPTNFYGKGNAAIAQILVVGGGGGGGGSNYGGGGGGGGGGVVYANLVNLDAGNSYSIQVGAGGGYNGGHGTDSFFRFGELDLTANGGGSQNAVGGSGGGANAGYNSGGAAGNKGYAKGVAADLYGNNGGNQSGRLDDSNKTWYGGGGGATQGGNAKGQGQGGNGVTIPAFAQFGVDGIFAGGGGAGGYRSVSGPQYAGTAGGTGGGGPSGSNGNSRGKDGAGGGGGAGAGGERGSIAGDAGGSGVVLIRYEGSPQFNGGNRTEAGGYTYHQFVASGALTPL